MARKKEENIIVDGVNEEMEPDGKDESVELDDDSKLVQHIMQLYREYKGSTHRDDYLGKDDSEIKDARKRYNQERDEKTFPWINCSNKQMPMSAVAVDHLEPRIVGMLVSDEQFVGVRPVGEEDIQNVDKVKKEIEWLLKNKAQWEAFCKDAVHDFLIDGTIFPITLHEETTKQRRQRIIQSPEIIAHLLPEILSEEDQFIIPTLLNDPEFPNNIPPEILDMVPDYKDVESTEYSVIPKVLNLEDVFAPARCENFKEEPTLRFISPEYQDLLKKTEESGGPYFNISKELITTEDSTERKTNPQDDKHVQGSRYKNVVDCLECYLKWDIEDDERGYDWIIATVALDKQKLIRKQRLIDVYFSNEKPIRRIPLLEESGLLYAHGIPYIIRHIEKGCTDLYNQMIDSGTIQIDPWFFYEPASGYDPDEMEIAPGKGVPVQDASKVHFPNLSVSATAYLEFINFLLAMFERLVSLSDFGMGRESNLPGRGGQTLGGINLITQQGEIQHSYRGRKIQNAFSEIIKDIYLLYVQTVPLDMKKRIFTDGKYFWEQIDIEGITGNYDFEITLSPFEANNEYKQQKMMNFIGASQSVAQFINPIKVTEEVLKVWDKKPVQEWMNQEIVQLIQQHFQQKQAEAEQQEMMNKEQKGLQRRAIHTQSDMGPGAGQRLAEIEKQVQEGIVKDQIKGRYGVGQGGPFG